MTIQDELLKILVPHFEEYQRQGQDEEYSLSLDASATKLKTKIASLELTLGVENLTLEGNKGKGKKGKTNQEQPPPSSSEVEEELGKVLVQFIDATVASDATSDLADPVDRVLSLIAAFGVAYSMDVASVILDRAVEYSTVLLERVRGHACILLGKIATALMKQRKKATTNKDGGNTDDQDFAEESLDIVLESLIPRLQDKSQSVRCHAIGASGVFFEASNDNAVETYEALLEAMLWNLVHDPSVSNRITAVQSVPIHPTATMDYLIDRVRDVKAKVRVEALEVLRKKAFSITEMTEGQLVQLIQSGFTNRCGVTKKAASKLLCTGWMKQAKFDPFTLLKLIGVIENEEEANQVLTVIMEASRAEDHEAMEELSDPEIRAFRSGLEKAAVPIGESEEISPEQIFYLRARCNSVLNSKDLTSTQKDAITSKLIPEIPVLCETFEDHSKELVRAIQQNDEDKQDAETFICLQILQLAELADLAEEGSRRHFAHVMKHMLSSIETPDDLVEGCINALRKACDREAELVDNVKEILESINKTPNASSDGEETTDSYAGEEMENMETIKLVRILSILAVVLETASSRLASNPAVKIFAKYIVPSVTNKDPLVREAAVGCFGKLGLFTDEATVTAEFKTILLEVATREEEIMSIRAQALLALADWSMLFSDCLAPSVVDGREISFVDAVRHMMDDSRTAVICVSAEIAAKLLFAKRVCDSEWFAKLLSIFFDPRMVDLADEDEDVKEIGSPTRLHQLLTLFFPAVCMKEDASGRDAMMGSILPLLHLIYGKLPTSMAKGKKGSKKKVTWPVAKMVQYVCSTVDAGKPSQEDDTTAVQENKDDEDDDAANTTAVASVAETEALAANGTSILAGLQLAEFLAKGDQVVTDTEARALCKILGTTEFDADEEEYKHMLLLKRYTEELGMVITDAASLKYLSAINEKLSGIEVNEVDDTADDEDDAEESNDNDQNETLTDEEEEKEHVAPLMEMSLNDDLIESLQDLNIIDTSPIRDSDKENTSGRKRNSKGSTRKISGGSSGSRRPRRLRLSDTN